MNPYLFILQFFYIVSANAAATIEWGCNINSVSASSGGTPITSEYIFELGSFDNSFVLLDRSTWAGAWQVFDRTRYNEEDQAYQKISILQENEAPFETSTQAYVWGYRAGGEVGEWLLYTDSSWRWPNASSIFPVPAQWFIDAATEVLAGAVQPNTELDFQTSLIEEAEPAMSWLEWQALSFSEGQLAMGEYSDWLADPDGDGICNGFEYFFGSNPVVSSRSNAENWSVHNNLLDSYAELRLYHAQSPDANIQLERSSALDTWVDASEDFDELSLEKKWLHLRSKSAVQGDVFYRIALLQNND